MVNGWELALIGLGLLIQIIGSFVTFAGINALWRIVAKEGETFRSLLAAQLRTTSQSIIDAARRLIGKPRGRTEHAQFTDHIGITDAIDVTRTFTKLSPDISTADAICELENRINTVLNDITETTNTLKAEREERRGSLETLRSDMTSELTSHAEEERRQSVRALRSEIAGFWLITFGFILQGVGSIIGAWS